jgi:hypothetical protein
MNRSARVLCTAVLGCICFVAGCGGAGSSTSTNPPPPSNPTPTISSISPSSVVAGASATTISITGSGFISASTAQWNGTALATTYVSATALNATVPTSDLTGSSQDQIAVQNPAPGGGTSGANSFSVNSPSPAITSISPQVLSPGSPATTVTLTGTGFESNSVVLWNSSTRPTTFVSSTSLQVVLSATDLQSQGTGSLTVSNPSPGAATSSAAQFAIEPVPVIQSVSIASATTQGNCTQLQATITGQNFTFNSTVQISGVAAVQSLPETSTIIIATLPIGFESAAGALTFTVTDPGIVPAVSAPYSYPSNSPAALALCVQPSSPTTVYAGTGFSATVIPTAVNLSGSGTLTLGSLPTGVTTTDSSLPPLIQNGAVLHFQAASSIPAGSDQISMTGTLGGVTANGVFNFTLSTGTPPGFSFVQPIHTELGVPIGGSGTIAYATQGTYGVDYDVTPSVSGLPPGTTAILSPSVFRVGDTVNVTLTAASNAPVTQNAVVTLTGTPASTQVAAATTTFFADVTQPPGSLPGNRTDFVSTAGTPYAAAYDATHNLIFSSNPSWNRVDVISNLTHKIVKSIPIKSPRGLDITQDNSQVWVQSASQNIYAIDTSSLQASHYVLPNSIHSSGLPVQFPGDNLLALSDGTLFVFFNDFGAGGSGEAGIWNPQTNQLKVLSNGTPSFWETPVRSGNGAWVYASNNNYGSGMEVYNVASQALSTIGSGTLYSGVVAVNQDGSQILLASSIGLSLYDKSLNLLAMLSYTFPGLGVGFPQDGGVLFSADGTKLYVSSGLIATVDISNSSTPKVLGTAPGSGSNPVGVSGAAETPTPFAIDSTGMLLGLQIYGITFDDSTFYQNYAANQPSNTNGEYLATFAGPLAGGTVSNFYDFPALIPDVWFGQTRGATGLSSDGELTFTSPSSSTPGPVNIKFIFPDGEQGFYPQLFSYSTFPQYAVSSGSSPNGGAAAQVIGYGLPQDASGGTLAIGGNTATITTTAGQYPPLSGEPYPSTILAYTFPPGTPGWADMQISTPIGSGALAKSIFYAKSVTDYASADSSAFTSVVVDEKRDQVYVGAGDHIDVFSPTSGQFVAAFQPPATGSQKQFSALAMTPADAELLAADFLDGSLAVINPDSPSGSYAIAISPEVPGVNNCGVGPLYVAGTSTNLAFVAYGSFPAPSCPQYGNTYVANLSARTAAAVPASAACGTTALSVDASSDGNYIAFGSPPCIYSAQNATYSAEPFVYGNTNEYGITISGDANVVFENDAVGDINLNMLGAIARPIPFYGNTTTPNPLVPLLPPRLNASGSLYYVPYPTFFEVIDVQHATLRMRFALTETIQNTAAPLAIDSGGRFVYLLTDKGLTVVDLGAAPLSIGHLSPLSAPAGTQVTVRGSGFDSGTTAKVGGTAAAVSFTDENTLLLTIPSVGSGPQDIVLTRSDGESYTLENGVVVQ